MAFLVQYIVTEAIGGYEGDFSEHWRIVFSFPFSTIIAEFMMLIFVYDFETPKYLLQNGR